MHSSRGGILQSVTKYLYQKSCYKFFKHPYPTIKVFLDSRCFMSKVRAVRTSTLIARKKKNEITILLQSGKDFCHQFSGNLKKDGLKRNDNFYKYSQCNSTVQWLLILVRGITTMQQYDFIRLCVESFHKSTYLGS